MTPDQTFILAVLAVVVTPLINYFITAQTAKVAAERAKEAALAARETALAIETLRGEANAAYEKADHFNAKIEGALKAVAITNGKLTDAVTEEVLKEGSPAATVDHKGE